MLPAGSRRSKIRPPRKSLVSPDSGADQQDYDASWQVLANAIVQIQNKNVSNLLYEQLYRKAYTMVLRKCGGKLYDDVALLITQHLKSRRQAVLRTTDSALTASSEEFLKAVVAEWAEHLQLMKFTSDVLMYLNRVYVKENKKLLIYDLGIVLFDVAFVRANDMEIGARLVDVVIAEIARARSGHVITTRLYIQQVVTMLEILSEERPGTALSIPSAHIKANLYLDVFESRFLALSETYFNKLTDEFLAALQGTKFLHDVHQFVHAEEARLKYFVASENRALSNLIHAETYSKMVSLMNNILIKNVIDKVILFPAEMQGLLYWLEPIMAGTVRTALGSSTSGGSRDSTPELRILYELVGRVDPECKLLQLRLKEAIVAQGLQLPDIVSGHLEQQNVAAGAKKASLSMNSAQFATRWIDTVLEYQRHFGQLVRNAFGGDPVMDHAIFSAMRDFINAPARGAKKKAASSAPEVLSVYMDFHIKQFSKSAGSKRLATDNQGIDETEDFLHRAISFLKFIKDKDAFEAHYAAHFAKRFLNAKGAATSVSDTNGIFGGDLEELVIAKLGEEIGRGSSSFEKIVKMKKDMRLSIELTSDWRNHVTQNSLLLVELDLKICNVSDWPKSMTKDYKSFTKQEGEVGFIWPSQLRETMKTFEEFWLLGKRNDNKTLFWSPKFGLMDLRITYPSRTYDINLSTYAGIIMLLFAPQSTDADGDPVLAFAENRKLTYDEIYELTKIPEADLKRQLQSIAVAPRLRLLVKTPMSKDVNSGDVFLLNSAFKSPTTKVKVLTVSASSSAKETKVKSEKQEEAEEVQANIEEGRKLLVNAAIVRIMKSRQTINHNELIGELVKQLQGRFQPLTLLIKQRIEDLIDKEYLKRDDELPNVYHYIA